MDIGALKQDLRRSLDLLPKEMVNPVAVGKWLQQHRAKLELIIPSILEAMKPHVMAGMMEAATGMADMDEIERACIEVLLSYGVEVAETR
jgi:hypothetical protein